MDITDILESVERFKRLRNRLPTDKVFEVSYKGGKVLFMRATFGSNDVFVELRVGKRGSVYERLFVFDFSKRITSDQLCGCLFRTKRRDLKFLESCQGYGVADSIAIWGSDLIDLQTRINQKDPETIKILGKLHLEMEADYRTAPVTVGNFEGGKRR